MLGPDDDVQEAFAGFWSEERIHAYEHLCEREDLAQTAVEGLVRAIVFTGKRPLADDVVAAMNERPGILKRRAAVERVIVGLEQIIATFDEGMGELDA